MSCSSCGSNAQNCGCVSAQSCSGGQPYYACTDVCPENHCQTTIVPQLATAVKAENQLNMPECGELAVINISNLIAVHIGSYLWSDEFGYLEITDYDLTSGRITVRNNCNSDNASPGTEIPVCSTFIVTDPPEGGSSGQSDLFPFVAIDFTAPANGACIPITVTTVNGLVVGKTVQIGTGIYRVQAITSPTNIDICNDGSGITPGTSVIAKNGAGEFQYPIVLIDSNPCTNPLLTQGTLLACDSGVSSPITGAVTPSVPVLIDAGTGEVQFQKLSMPELVCTTLTCPFTILVGVTTYTNVEVADTTGFTVGKFVQLDDITDGRFQITAIPGGTLLDLERTTAPLVEETFPIGTSLCELECCEELFEQFGGILTPCSDFENERYSEQAISDQLKIILDVITTEGESDDTTCEVQVFNNSECRGMEVMYHIQGRAFGSLSNPGNANSFRIRGVLNQVIDTVPLQVMTNNKVVPDQADGIPYDLHTAFANVVSIAPGTNKIISGKYKIVLTTTHANQVYDLSAGAGGIDCVVTVIGIAVGP